MLMSSSANLINMKNSNLVATPIVNKNGVRTTVYKRDATPPTVAATLPSPAITANSSPLSLEGRSEIITMINEHVKESQSTYEWNPKKWSYGDLGTTLHSCSDDAIIAIRDLLLTAPKGFLSREEREDFLFALARKDEKVSGTTIHEYLTYSDHLKGVPMNTKMGLLRGLHSYAQLPAMKNYSYADQGTKASIVVLLSATKSLYSHNLLKNIFGGSNKQAVTGNQSPVIDDDGGMRLTDSSLVALLIERPEASSEIEAVITEKGIIDGNLIREMIDSDTPSIRDGLL